MLVFALAKAQRGADAKVSDVGTTRRGSFTMKRYVGTLTAAMSILGLVQAAKAMETSAERGKTVVIQGAKIIDGTGKDPIAEGTIFIRGDKIQKVVSGSAKAPKGAQAIDAHGKTVIPTLTSAHSHLGLIQGPVGAAANMTEANVMRQMKHYAKHGVGTVMSLGTDYDFIYGIRDKRNKKEIDGAYILTAGHGFGVEKGVPPVAMGIDKAFRPATADEAVRELREMITAHRPDIIKIWVDDNLGQNAKIKPEITYALIDEAHKNGVRVAAHVWYLADAKDLVKHGVDVIGHSVRDQHVDDEFIKLMKEHGTYQIATLDLDEAAFIYKDKPEMTQSAFFVSAAEPGVPEFLRSEKYVPKEFERKALENAKFNIKALHDAGVKLGFGTDSGAKPERVQGFAEHRELQLLVESGLTPVQAIHAATGGASELLHVANRMGTIEPGKLANLIILDADPTQDIANTQKINTVWMDGQNITAKLTAEARRARLAQRGKPVVIPQAPAVDPSAGWCD